ncbi:unnamed protein product [Microthlaspi erraticum]|uniref:Uncharacterized protein n=1 Tax=Microthlaspi erraticum TaxID=1685480 RepID=A0A6D2J6T2_9BRAS|nr:unnamed protein product [Microthlaspi erraticum]
MAESATKKTSASMMMMPDWTQLPEEILEFISEKLDNCFQVIHARSVCSFWRSTIPFPCSLLRPSYSLPTYPIEKVGLCSLEKIPMFLFRVRTLDDAASASVFFLGRIGRRDHIELSSPIQCSVRVKIGESDPTLINMLDCQILSLGHQYRLINWSPEGVKTTTTSVACLPLNKERRMEFVVLVNYQGALFVLTSGAKRKWKLLENNNCGYRSLFPGRDSPDSIGASRIFPTSGNDELLLLDDLQRSRAACRLSRLDEEEGKWVEVTDLGDRVLFIHRGHLGNVCCSAKEFPDGCCLTGNSILITRGTGEEVWGTLKCDGREEDYLR